MGFLFIAFDILPSSCHTGLTTFKMYSWKLRSKGIVLMIQTLHFKFYKNIIKQKYLFSSSDLNFGPIICHYKIYTHTTQNKTDVVENGCKARLEYKYMELYKMWRTVSFKIYNCKAQQNLQHTLTIYAPYLSHFSNCMAFIFFLERICRTQMFQLSAQKQFHASIQEGSAWLLSHMDDSLSNFVISFYRIEREKLFWHSKGSHPSSCVGFLCFK